MQRAILARETHKNSVEVWYRNRVDEDRDGPAIPGDSCPAAPAKNDVYVPHAACEESMSFGHQLARGEYVWTLHQFSWLPTVLTQRELGYLESSHFQVGKFTFEFVYNPHHGALTPSMTTGQCGSLAIAPYESSEIALRYAIFIKKRGGDFVQWGKTCFEVHDGSEKAYGPDVHHEGKAPATVGIFGLTHEELLESEWVENDTLTVKFVLEVRPDEHFMSQLLRPTAEVPGPTLNRDMQALFEDGICSDVQFKAFLRFLYTDCLPTVAELSGGNGEAKAAEPDLSRVQALLAVSHKYQTTRLQLWCDWALECGENQLCQGLKIAEVCSILEQANLLDAQQLVKACLSFIKDHLTEVFKLPDYIELAKRWPDVGMKISLVSAGVPEAKADEVVQASKKR
ncbi:BPM6, partial [Symbiodinium sp. KB8]